MRSKNRPQTEAGIKYFIHRSLSLVFYTYNAMLNTGHLLDCTTLSETLCFLEITDLFELFTWVSTIRVYNRIIAVLKDMQ